MHAFTIPILALLLFACTPTSKEGGEADKPVDTLQHNKGADALLHTDTLQLNDLTLIQHSKEGKFVSLVTLSGDTVVKEEEYYFQVAYPDIDEDGYKDIRVSVFSKTPNQSQNYLYDKQALAFRPIANSDLDIKKVKGTKLYYSYNSTGCSDQSWESHLSKIEDWQEIPVGYIEAKGCGDKEDGIYLYKVVDDKDSLLEQLPIEAIRGGKKDKWSFIEQYWTRNASKFHP